MSAPAIGASKPDCRRLYFSVSERCIAAEIEDPGLVEPLRRLFPSYEIPRPQRHMPDQVDVTLLRQSGMYVVSSVDSPDVVCRKQIDAIVALEFALSRLLAASFSEYVHLHASGSVVDGKAVLALGRSGAGKSSLAVSWLSHGFKTLGDDIVFVDSAAMAMPFKRLFKVAPETLRELGVDPTTTFQWDPGWPEAWYSPDDGAGWATEAPVAVLAFVQYEPHSALRLTPLSKPDALNSVVHSLMDTGKRAAECFDTLMRLVQNARVVRVEYPLANEAAEALCSLTK